MQCLRHCEYNLKNVNGKAQNLVVGIVNLVYGIRSNSQKSLTVEC
jgi:hypothetical protein